jgi:tRNA pseudouridine38-40 synthase
MPRYRLTLSYDGTEFAGWQLQAPSRGARTVQGVLEQALSRLAHGQAVRVMGAGRTDAGAHALGQVASCELPQAMTPADLQRALNAMLPEDLRVCEAVVAPPDFHARRRATAKLYRYVLDTGPFQPPLRRRAAAHIHWQLDEGRVCAAASLFLGERDFASLASAGGSVRTTVRRITRSEACFEDLEQVPSGRTLIYEVEGSGFLRKMVRSIVGGLIAVGRGAATADELERALFARDRRAWPAPAAACGLTLVRVEYEPAAES